jgi:hypothetical protein
VQLTVSGVSRLAGAGRRFKWSSVVGEAGDADVGEQAFPMLITPEDFQTKESFIALDAPELAAALHAALHLATGGFDSSRAHGFIALFAGEILHPLLVAAVVLNRGAGDLG